MIQVDRNVLKDFTVSVDSALSPMKRVRLNCAQCPRWGVSYAQGRVVTLETVMGDVLSHAWWHGSDDLSRNLRDIALTEREVPK